MAGKLDARAKLASTLVAVVAVSSTPSGAWIALSVFVALTAAWWIASCSSFAAVVSRVAAGVPFILMAALLMWLANGWEHALTIAVKGTVALVLLALLVITTEVSSLIWAIRKLGAPRAVNMIAAMMLRYVAMLSEEFGRMSRARAARAGGPLAGIALFQVHGNQTGLLLVRSWERAERIHAAMLSRGFTGTMPEIHQGRFGGRDIAFTATAVICFLATRLLLA